MNRPGFVYVTYISSTPEKVWAALLDGEMTKLYWGMKKNVSPDWKAGSPWEHADYETGEAAVRGTVVEAEPPRRLVLTWASTDPRMKDEKPSRVTFEIVPFMDAVRLTVTHDELSPGGAMEKGVSSGWPAILSSLKTLLETGHPMPMTTRRWTAPPPA